MNELAHTFDRNEVLVVAKTAKKTDWLTDNSFRGKP